MTISNFKLWPFLLAMPLCAATITGDAPGVLTLATTGRISDTSSTVSSTYSQSFLVTVSADNLFGPGALAFSAEAYGTSAFDWPVEPGEEHIQSYAWIKGTTDTSTFRLDSTMGQYQGTAPAYCPGGGGYCTVGFTFGIPFSLLLESYAFSSFVPGVDTSKTWNIISSSRLYQPFNVYVGNVAVSSAAVDMRIISNPEPESWLLMGGGLFLIALPSRRLRGLIPWVRTPAVRQRPALKQTKSLPSLEKQFQL